MTTISISEKEYEQLKDASEKLNALELGGVDNWTFFDEALTEYNKEKEIKEREKETKDKIKNLGLELLEELTDLINEPSERGAGFAIGHQDDDAENIVLRYFNTIRLLS